MKGLLAKCRKDIQCEFDLSPIQFNFNQVFSDFYGSLSVIIIWFSFYLELIFEWLFL